MNDQAGSSTTVSSFDPQLATNKVEQGGVSVDANPLLNPGEILGPALQGAVNSESDMTSEARGPITLFTRTSDNTVPPQGVVVDMQEIAQQRQLDELRAELRATQQHVEPVATVSEPKIQPDSEAAPQQVDSETAIAQLMRSIQVDAAQRAQQREQAQDKNEAQAVPATQPVTGIARILRFFTDATDAEPVAKIQATRQEKKLHAA